MNYLTGNVKIKNTTQSESATYAGNNITITASNVPTERPWMAYYMTSDDFFDLLRIAFEDTYGDKKNNKWHPEDLYINVSCVLEVVSNTLANAANIASKKPLKGVKEVY